jgi:Flp pilus assembly protein TadD
MPEQGSKSGMPTLSESLALAVKCHQAGDVVQAERLYREILLAHPCNVDALHLLGLIAFQAGRFDAAVDWIRQSLHYKPEFAEAQLDLGRAFLGTGKREEATACLREAVRLKPDLAAAHYHLGLTLWPEGRLEEAEACFRHTLRLAPDWMAAQNPLGFTLALQGRLEEALALFQGILRFNPRHAEAHMNQALVWLLQGRWADAWSEHEWRWQCKQFPPPLHPPPFWDGSPLAGRTILLWAEQGMGDTFQFLRYVPLVKERGGTVIVECQKPLVRLLAGCPGVDQLVAQGSRLAGSADVHAPLMSLPGVFGTTPDATPAPVPYIHADARLVERWRLELAPSREFKIAIVWQGDPSYRRDRQRSIPLACFEPLARLPGVRLFSLQKGYGIEQLRQAAFPVTDLGPRLDETAGPFMDTAAVLRCVDLVVASDTAVLHLAGALGVRVWAALPYAPDWRWLLDRDDSPWYPTARLFRQTTPGDWAGVFERITAAVRQLLARSNGAGEASLRAGPAS